LGELERQRSLWSKMASLTAERVLIVDTVEQGPTDIAHSALDRLRRDAPCWIRAPFAPRRLQLSMHPTGSSVPALQIYRPHRTRARAAARVNAALVSRGLGRRTAEPVPGLADLAAQMGLSYDGAAALRSSTPNRLIVGLARSGSLQYVLKIGDAE